MNTKSLFISHSWRYNDEYKRLTDLLINRGYFSFKDYSVPKDDPIRILGKTAYERKLREGIINQMRFFDVVILIAGKYVTYSDSIQMELQIAREMGKPILAIRPYGANQTTSLAEVYADRIVNWNSDSIVDAIRELS